MDFCTGQLEGSVSPMKLISGVSCTWDRMEDTVYVTPHYVLVRILGFTLFFPCPVLLACYVRKSIYARLTDRAIPHPRIFQYKIGHSCSIRLFFHQELYVFSVFPSNIILTLFFRKIVRFVYTCAGPKLVVALTKNQTRFDQTVWKWKYILSFN